MAGIWEERGPWVLACTRHSGVSILLSCEGREKVGLGSNTTDSM